MAKRILIIYLVPRKTIKHESWHDGFVAAIDILRINNEIIFHNLADIPLTLEKLDSYDPDVILVKSNFGAKVDRYFRYLVKDIRIPTGLLISGSKPPPDNNSLAFYNVLFYETHWYEPQIKSHGNIFHAFGIDTSIMKPLPTDKDIDWLSVGLFKNYKRQYKLINKPGKKVILGEKPKGLHKLIYFKQENRIIRRLIRNGVKLVDFVAYSELCGYYNRAHNVYIPSSLHGGGERAVLEARACKIPVQVEDDNPKLKSLLACPIYDHLYYADQLQKGIESIT